MNNHAVTFRLEQGAFLAGQSNATYVPSVGNFVQFANDSRVFEVYRICTMYGEKDEIPNMVTTVHCRVAQD